MKIKSTIFIFIVFAFVKIYSQENIIPKVTIKDHNNNTGIINIDCDYNFYGNKEIKLIADYPLIKGTNSYSVSSVQSTPFPFQDNNEVIADIHGFDKKGNYKKDDTFGAPINLPFEFCFYGNKYSQIVISDNGVISFNVKEYAQKDCAYSIINNVPVGLIKNAIFGVYHDMINVDRVKYYVTGEAPYRKFVLVYDDIPQYGYDQKSKYSSSQIVLYETTNVIDVYIKDRFKNENTNSQIEAGRKNAVVGITNFDSSIGLAASGRDTGNWDAHNEGWRFTPEGYSNIYVRWYDEYNHYLGSGNSILQKPTIDTKYKVEVTYQLCSPITVKDEIEIKVSKDFPKLTPVETEPFCIRDNEKGTVNLNNYLSQLTADKGLMFTYHLKADASDTPLSDSEVKDFKFSDKTTVYVKALRSGECFSISTITIKVNKTPNIQDKSSLTFCAAIGKSTINLIQDVANKLSGFNFSTMGIKFYTSFEDAESGDSEITNLDYLLKKSKETLYFRVWNSKFNDLTCYNIFSVNLYVNENLDVKPRLEVNICYVENKQDIEIDLTQFNKDYFNTPPSGYKIKYYTYKSGNNYYNPINDPTKAKWNMELEPKKVLYVEIISADGCKAYSELYLIPDSNCDGKGDKDEVEIGGPTGPGGPTVPGDPLSPGGGPICDAPDGTEYTVDLVWDYLRFFLPKGLTLNDIEVIGFYEDENCTKSIPNPYSITTPIEPLTVYAKYTMLDQKVTVVTYFPLVAMKKIELNKSLAICDDDPTINEKEVGLSSANILLEELYPKYDLDIIYFASEQDAVDYISNPDKKDNIIYSILVQRGITAYVYALVQTYGCNFIYKIPINFKKIEREELPLKLICDFGSDGKEMVDLTQYEDEICKALGLTEEDLKTLQDIIYYVGKYEIPNPKTFVVDQPQLDFQAKVVLKNQCPAFVNFSLQLTTTVSLPEIQDLYICDTDNNNEELINLSLAISNPDPNSAISFYTDKQGAEEGGTNAFYIGTYDIDVDNNPVNHLMYGTLLNIYVRVEDKNSKCFKVLPFKVSLVKYVEIEKTEIKICDYGNDNSEKLDIQQIKKQLIANNIKVLDDANMSYAFYNSEDDAKNGLNEITTSFTATNTNNIWVKITTKLAGCSTIFKLNFHLVESPRLVELPTIMICNNNTANSNGEISEKVNLDKYRNGILGFGVTSDYVFTYYNSEQNALSGGNNGRLNSNHTLIAFPTTIYVRVNYTPTGCFSVVPLTFNQYPSLDGMVQDSEIIACARGELRKEVDLTEYPPQMIVSPATIDEFFVKFYTSKNAAISINGIPIPDDQLSEYIVTPSTEIWLKFISKETGCYILKKLAVTIYGSPKAQDIYIDVCDETDGVIDGNFVISSLDYYKDKIILGEPNLENLYIFTYYKDYQSAEEGNVNNVSGTNFTFQESDLIEEPGELPYYRIWTRIDKTDGTGCYSVVAITFTVNPKAPVNEEVPEILECDDSDNDGKTKFDLSSVSDKISSTATGFKYYPTETDARNNTNEIKNFTEWKNTIPYNQTVYVRVSQVNHCDNIDSIKLKVYPYIKAEDHSVTICEFNFAGKSSTVNLNEEVKNMIKNINSSLFPNLLDEIEISYHTSEDDAHNKSNQIPESQHLVYVPQVGQSDVWVRFQSKVNKCYEVKKFTINKIKAPVLNKVEEIICDDNLDDEFEITLNTLDVKVPVILGGHTITYHGNKAQAWDNKGFIDKDVPFLIPVSQFPKTIAVRVVDNNTGCVNTTEINLVTNPKANLDKEEEYILECDESDNDGFTNYDLTSVAKNISSTANQFVYYQTKEDAQNDVNPIKNPKSWKIATAYDHTVYVRVRETNFCDNLAAIKLKVYPYIQAEDYRFTICEFDNLGNPHTVDLKEEVKNMTKKINSTLFPNLLDEIEISYYISEDDALNKANQLPEGSLSTYLPEIGINEFWIRFQSTVSKCYEIKKLTITKTKAPEINEINELVCDDNLDDVYEFVLNTLDSKVPVTTGTYTISYHLDKASGWSNTQVIDKDNPYIIPISEFTKTIAVRIVDNNTGCVNVREINLITNPKVTLDKEEEFILECDESDNDGFTNFDLTSIAKNISSTANQFVYYKTKEDAQNDVNPIKNPKSWKIATAYNHTVYVRVRETNFCDNLAAIKLKVYPYIQAEDYRFTICEFDNLGNPHTVDLKEEVKNMTKKINSSLFPNLLDEIEISYYTSEDDALNKANQLPEGSLSTYLPEIGTNEIWVRFQSTVSKCYEIKKLTITKTKAPEINEINELVCDYNLDNVYEIVLNTLDSKVPVSTGSYTISYHLDKASGWSNTQVIGKDNPYIIPVSEFIKTIAVRVVDNTTGCVNVREINLITNPKVTLDKEEEYILECDESDNDGFTNFDLTSVAKNISSTANQFVYYQTKEDAQNDVNPIKNPKSWKIATAYDHTVYVRVRETNFCDNLAAIKLKVYPYIQAEDYRFTICEFDNLGNPHTVDLKEEVKNMTKKINSSLFPNLLDEIEISYYTSEDDALNKANQLPEGSLSTYLPEIGTNEIWVRFQSTVSKCYEIKKLTITKTKAPEINEINELVCDYNLDNVYEIVLNTLDSKVPVSTGSYTISYHLDKASGWSNTQVIGKDNPYIIPVSEFIKTIAVRVVDNTTGCVNVREINLITNPKVTLDKEEEYILECDESDNDGFTNFDLTSVAQNIAGTAEEFFYYETKEDAQKDENQILNPESWNIATAYNHTVYVRVRETNFCDNLIAIKLKVYPYIDVVDFEKEYVCEFTSTGSETLIDLEKEVRDHMDKMDVKKHPELENIEITYYTTEDGAQNKESSVQIKGNDIKNYLAPVGVTDIWVRFHGRDINGQYVKCFEVRKLTINKLAAPELKPVNYAICDDDLDGKFYIIPTELKHSGFIIDPDKYDITYYESKQNAWGQLKPLSPSKKYTISKFPTSIFVRVIDEKGCVNVGEITIVTNSQVTVKDVGLTACDGNNDGYAEFNLTIVENDITNEENVKFSYFRTLKDAQENDNPIQNIETYTNRVKNGEVIYVRVDELMPLGEKCPSLAKISLKTYYPENPLEEEIYICPRTELTIDGGDYDTWEWSTPDGFINGDTDKRYVVVSGVGTYYLTVTRNLNYGLICSATFSITVKPLKDPVILDLKEGKDYVTVIAQGPQPLQYSIDNENWQFNRTFSNLQPGIYTFYVRSIANGCIAVSAKTILFAIPNVITPNGDGKNDYWQLCGLEFFDGEPSTIKIFDRYGKVVHEQTSSTCFKWDGYYLGRQLPTTSYWYVITVADGRKFTGWILLRNYGD